MRAELEQAIRAAPDDPAAYAVYADWLDREGDPRGRFMLLHQARSRPDVDVASVEAELARLETKESLAPWLRDVVIGPKTRWPPLRWRHGAVQSAHILRFPAEPPFGTMMRNLFAHPAAAFLRGLALGSVYAPDQRPTPGLDGALAALAHAPITLESLHLIANPARDGHKRSNPVVLPKANRIFKFLPRLRHLVLDADECDIQPFAAPRLERVDFVRDTLRGALVPALEQAQLPELRVLHFGVAEAGAANVDALFRMRADKLEAVAVRGMLGKHVDADMLMALLAWPGLSKLRRLALHHPRSPDGSFDGSTLLAARRRWEHLEELRIVPTYPDHGSLLADIPNVRIMPAEPSPYAPQRDPLETLCAADAPG